MRLIDALKGGCIECDQCGIVADFPIVESAIIEAVQLWDIVHPAPEHTTTLRDSLGVRIVPTSFGHIADVNNKKMR